jgi:hypothetical protein
MSGKGKGMGHGKADPFRYWEMITREIKIEVGKSGSAWQSSRRQSSQNPA